jgi:hypothetical protein
MNEIPFKMNGAMEVWRVYFVQRKATIAGRRGRQALIFWIFLIKQKEQQSTFMKSHCQSW